MYLSSCYCALQDKVGPFARSAADAAVVLDVIRGRDPADPSSFDADLDDPFSINVQTLTVGVLDNTPTIVSAPTISNRHSALSSSACTGLVPSH